MAPARRIAAVALAVTLMTAAPLRAQDTVEAAPVEGEIYIENIAPQPLTFGLSDDNETWNRFLLAPDQVAVYGGSDAWFFLVVTEGVELRYRLNDQGSYRLYWNEVDMRWDLLTCSEPACGRLTAE